MSNILPGLLKPKVSFPYEEKSSFMENQDIQTQNLNNSLVDQFII